MSLSLYVISISKNAQGAMLCSQWRKTMDKEMEALKSRGDWELVASPK